MPPTTLATPSCEGRISASKYDFNYTAARPGVIHALKVQYHRQLVRKLLVAIEEGGTVQELVPSVDLLKASWMLKRALSLISPATIQNCFRKAEFLFESADNPDPSQILQLNMHMKISESSMKTSCNM